MTERPYTTGLYLLRCYELGLTLSELSLLDYGVVTDMLIEKGNDGEKYRQIATQDDMNKF